ncbi:MAG: hypothetical protein E7018_06890 [Alphaproteobacteria bacterium]|nr:hypothetical protein [Alphaproteobacteria bacterium]
MTWRTILKSTLAATFVSTFVVARVEAVTSSDLAKMEQKVRQQSMEHKKLQAQATQINLELTTVSREMIKAAKKIQNNEEKLSQMERQLEKLKEDLKVAEEGFTQEDDNLIKTLAALQNLALKPTEALLVQPLTPVEIIRSAMVLRETVPYLEENATRIRKELEKIAQKKELVEKQFAQISKQKKILEREHGRMKALVQKKSKMRNAVEIKSEKAKKNVEKLASQANDLRDLLGKLEKQRAEKRRKEEQRRAEEAKRAAEKNRVVTYSDDLIKKQPPVITSVVTGFNKAKGSLPLPARGKIITTYGEQVVKGVTAKGITIRTRNMAQVVAPFDGSVMFSGPFRGYGNLIIIDHGDGYLSLLAGLQNMDVEVGQMLLAGEPVGQMPEEGDAKLYMEIRKDNQPLDPLAWVKV